MMDYLRRQKALSEQLSGLRVDALLITHLPNVRYLCGFSGSAGVLAITAHPGKGSSGRAAKAVLFTDGRYTEQARTETRGVRVVIGKASALAAAGKWVAHAGLRTVGVEAQHLTLAAKAVLKNALGTDAAIRETRNAVEQLRKIKDADEIECIREAVNLGASLMEVALKTIRPGVAESDVAAEMEYEARRRGAQGMSFDTIVAAGPRSALPHGVATAIAIPARGFVVLDFGVILHGYCSDMTRTVWVGKISPRERDLYEAVREAQQAAVETARAGVTCGEVDAAARGVLRRAGLGRYFTHSTGHGVGLEIHEEPRIARGHQEVLQPGMVITIEPGVYVPGRGGVRIEDMVVVHEAGCEVLTRVPKELVEL